MLGASSRLKLTPLERRKEEVSLLSGVVLVPNTGAL